MFTLNLLTCILESVQSFRMRIRMANTSNADLVQNAVWIKNSADDVWLPRALLPPRLPRARLGALLVRRGGVPLPALPAHADPRRAGHAQLDALHRAQLGGGARRRRRGASPAGLLEVERKTCFGFARRYSL